MCSMFESKTTTYQQNFLEAVVGFSTFRPQLFDDVQTARSDGGCATRQTLVAGNWKASDACVLDFIHDERCDDHRTFRKRDPFAKTKTAQSVR